MPSMQHRVYTCVIACSLAYAVQPTHAQGAGIASLYWLAGCWGSETAEAGSIEQWMPPAAGTMFGVGRTVKAGKIIEYEFLRILEAPDGRLRYVALPSGQKETTFTQLRLSDTEVVFGIPPVSRTLQMMRNWQLEVFDGNQRKTEIHAGVQA